MLASWTMQIVGQVHGVRVGIPPRRKSGRMSDAIKSIGMTAARVRVERNGY